MRDRMERFVILPFSVGCISEASVAVGIPQPIRKSSRQGIISSPPIIRSKGDEDENSESLSGESMKSSLRLLDIPKSTSNISTGFNKLFKGFKNLSQLFGEKEDLEELEMEMEIGCPTDVQHVTHIGWDGNATSNPIRGWDHLIPPEFLSFTSLSFQQYQPPSQDAAIANAQTPSSVLIKDNPSPSPIP